jgi:hypothetical protein
MVDNVVLDEQKLEELKTAIKQIVFDPPGSIARITALGEEVFGPHQDTIAKGTARIPGFCLFDDTGYDLELALRSVGPGWGQIIRDLYAVMPPTVRVQQVKEKYGGLRFYYGWADWENDERTLGDRVHLWLTRRVPKLMRYLPLFLCPRHWVIGERWDQAVHRAESQSYRVCEQCGAPGETNENGWLITLCRACRERYEQERTWPTNSG